MAFSRFFAGAGCALGLLVATASADQGWKGALIMPKSDQLQIRAQPGGYAKGDVFQIAWPATVERTDGRWLHIRDDGGYSANSLAGWVHADEVLKLDDAQKHYADRLDESPAPWLYWLEGIYWDTKNEPSIALAKFAQAVEAPGDPRLDDALIRTGRLRAASYYRRESDKDKSWQKFFDWQQSFEQAEKMNKNRPMLYLEWGNALRLKPTPPTQAPNKAQASTTTGGSAATGTTTAAETVETPDIVQSKAILALDKYNQASALNRKWWRIPMARAELLLDRCTTKPVKQRELGQYVPDARQLNPDSNANDLNALYQACHQLASATKNQNSANGQPVQKSTAQGNSGGATDKKEVKKPLVMTEQQDLVMATALQNFDRAIALNPASPDPYRDRAEVLWLESRFEEAKQSALTSCTMSDFRGPASLRMLAQIYEDLNDYDEAMCYAQQAAQYDADPKSRRQLFGFCSVCQNLSKSTSRTLVAGSPGAGQASTTGTGNAIGPTASGTGSAPMQSNNSPSENPPAGFILQSFGAFGR